MSTPSTAATHDVVSTRVLDAIEPQQRIEFTLHFTDRDRKRRLGRRDVGRLAPAGRVEKDRRVTAPQLCFETGTI